MFHFLKNLVILQGDKMAHVSDPKMVPKNMGKCLFLNKESETLVIM